MLRLHATFLTALILLLSSSASAQIADFSDQGVYGVRNDTNHMAAELGWQANQIEDDRYVVTAWCDFTAGNVSYFWRSLDKTTGVVNGPNLIPNITMNPGVVNMTPSLTRRFRPGMTFTKAPSGNPVAYAGMAIAVPAQDPFTNVVDVNIVFFRIDPASLPPASNQPVWIIDPMRSSLNVSASTGLSDSVVLACNNAGELAVAWRDLSTTGDIGGQSAINPIAPNPNPGALFAVDIFVTRLEQQFDAMNPVVGALDAALPLRSTRNLSSSFAQDSFPDIASDGTQRFMVAWQSFSAQSDDIAGLGASSGPKMGAFGAESTDIYTRSFSFPTTTSDILMNVGANVTSSQGTSNLPPSLDFNLTLGQYALTFLDNTTTGGIAGDMTLSSVPNGPIQTQVPVDDLYLALFGTNFALVEVVAVTQSPNPEILASVASLGGGGWAVAWGLNVTQTVPDIRAQLQTFDGVGQQQTSPRQYPRESISSGGNPQPVWPFAITGDSPDSISIAFSMSGAPDDLKAGQNGATGTNVDVFLAHGELTASGVMNGQIQITTFTVNDSQPLDPNAAAPSVEVKLSLRNSSSFTSVNLTNLTLSVPAGFTASGQGPNLPALMVPFGVMDLTLTYDVDSGALEAGQNEFSVSTTGNVGGNLTLSSAMTSLSVLGSAGGVVGVQVGYTFNPPVIRIGETTSANVTISVTNSGFQDLTGVSFEGALAPGFVPTNLSSLSLSPNPSTVTITSGSTQVFTGTLLVGSNLNTQDYRPAFTLLTSQGANVGTVTSQVSSPVQIIQGDTNQGGTAPATGLLNAGGGGGGCALAAYANWKMALLGFLGAFAFLMMRWRACRISKD